MRYKNVTLCLMGYLVNNRQFMIGERPLEAEGFVCARIGGGLWLSRHEGLRAAEIRNADGELVVLLGECHAAGGAEPEAVLEASSALSAEALAELTFGFAGRWAIVWKDVVIADACGLIPLFYGGRAVSSSLALMEEYAGFAEQDPDFRELTPGRMPDWVPAPATRLKGVRKALPSQYLRIGAAVEAVHLERLDPARFAGLVKDEIYDRFGEAMCALLRSVAARHKDVVIPLTAGYDSRTLVALASKAGIPFRTVSFTHKDISRADRKVPFEIARRLGFRHESIAPAHNPDPAAQEAWRRQTLGCCVSPDGGFLASGQLDGLGPESVLLRGNIWEMISYYWTWKLAPAGSAAEARAALADSLPSYLSPAMDEWLEDCFAFPRVLDWRDSLYYEQRQGCWLSYIEQGLDLAACAHIAPLDSSLLISMLLALDPETRAGRRYERELVERFRPEIADIPYNAKTLAERVCHDFSQLLRIKTPGAFAAALRHRLGRQ